jgi:hypothetical protein
MQNLDALLIFARVAEMTSFTRAAESLGIDIELHHGGPETMQCMAAIRNSNYHEWGLVHPKLDHKSDPLYADGHVDGFPDTISPDHLKALLTIAGGEAIDEARY